MFEVYILTPYASTLCVATFSRVLTSLNLGPVRDYGLHIVTTRPKSKRCMRLHPESALAVSPCRETSHRCHPKLGLATGIREGEAPTEPLLRIRPAGRTGGPKPGPG